MAVRYSLGNYHSIADAASMTLPDGDWTWLTIIRPGTDITAGQDIISSGVWGAANTFNIFISGGNIGAKYNDVAVDPSVSAVANEWTALMAVRRAGNFELHAVPMGSTTVRSDVLGSIAPGTSDGLGYHFGRRQDNGDAPFLGDMSDAILIKGVALTTTNLTDIANSTPMDSTTWWASREFHGIFSTAASELDNTGNHTITKTGSPTSVADPSQLVRFSGQTVIIVQTTEADTSQPVTAIKPIKATVAQVAETDTSQAVSAIKPIKATITQVFETDISQQITAQIANVVNITQVLEADTSQQVTPVKPINALIAQVAEIDQSQGLSAGKTNQITQVFETDISQALTAKVANAIIIGQVSEVDTSQLITPIKP